MVSAKSAVACRLASNSQSGMPAATQASARSSAAGIARRGLPPISNCNAQAASAG